MTTEFIKITPPSPLTLGIPAATKSVLKHPYRHVYDWFIENGSSCSGNQPASCFEVYSHAVANRGKVKPGVLMGSAEHAAALAGAAIWRLKNPLYGKGGPGRGQGRKAKDGHTAFIRMSVNVRPDQHQEFKAFGGSLWLRTQIDLKRHGNTPPDVI